MNKEKIKINSIGLIIAGEDKGLYVVIKDDYENTGGYLILCSPNYQFKDSNLIFDNWVKNENDLILFIKESGWIIDWDIHKNNRGLEL